MRQLEIRVFSNGAPIKSLKMYAQGTDIIVEETERRISRNAKRELDKEYWIPVFLEVFKRTQEARVSFIGRANMIAYEEGNQEQAFVNPLFSRN